MGGGGSYYDRDVTDQRYRSARGVSTVAERELQQSSMDPQLLPKNRRLICTAENPLVYDFDETGSMDVLPKIIYDKWPGIVGQVVARGYLPDPEMSITATGDIRSDDSPLQMCDFSPLRNLDKWLKRVHFEGNGGGQGSESYEMTAYYYANFCDMPKATNPIYLITGDEACVEKIYAGDLQEHFGTKGFEHADTTATEVFASLLKKFNGNVFRIQRRYQGESKEGWNQQKIVAQWEKLIGKERIIHLPEDLAIGDITLGVYAIISGARTLKQYLEDMHTRPLDLGKDVTYEPQSPERIRQVEAALQPLATFKPVSAKKTISSASAPKKGVSKGKSKPAAAKDDSWKL
jgi:hypothetical protein